MKTESLYLVACMQEDNRFAWQRQVQELTEAARSERAAYQHALEAAIAGALEEGHAQLFVQAPQGSTGPQALPDAPVQAAEMQTRLAAAAAASLALLDGVGRAMLEDTGDGTRQLRDFVEAQVQVLTRTQLGYRLCCSMRTSKCCTP
jgi:hypothetical protein